MEHIEDQIWCYGYLTPEEQGEVEAFVAVHPDYAPALEKARALHEVLRAAHGEGPAGPSDDALAAFLVNDCLGVPVPEGLRPAYERLQRIVRDAPAWRARREAMQRRMDGLTTSDEDPVARFERLSGHVMEPAVPYGPRLPARATRPPRLARRTAWAAGVAAVLAASLWIATAEHRAFDALAAVPASALSFDVADDTVRGDSVPDRPSPDAYYRYGVAALYYARRPGLGIRPTFDAGQLGIAERALRRTIEDAPPASVLAADARYFLAKVYLARHDIPAAVRVLDEAPAGVGRHAADAAALRARLRP